MMKREESGFFILNTPALWRDGAFIENVTVDGGGITLGKLSTVVAEVGPSPDFTPLGLAADNCGTLYSIDGGTGRIAVLEEHGWVARGPGVTLPTAPVAMAVGGADLYIAGRNELVCLARCNLQARWRLPVTGDDILDLACADDGHLYLLCRTRDDPPRQKVWQWRRRWGGAVPEFEKTALIFTESPLAIAATDGCLYLLYRKGGAYHVATADADGPVEKYLPVPLPADFEPAAMAVVGAGRMAVLSRSPGNNLIFISQGDGGFVPQGVWITKPLDSTIEGCRWHRVFLEADIPANTKVELSWWAFDEPSPYAAPVWSQPLINPKVALISAATGRYLRFRVALFSDDRGRFAPTIGRLKVEFPHHSYLRYLPAVYQEDDAGREFLERFLAVFETFFSEFEGRIFSFSRYLDPAGTPEAFLPWLARWLALSADETWPAAKVRELLQKAPELYQKRGTKDGIIALIELYTGRPDTVMVLESFQVEECREMMSGGHQRAVRPSANALDLVVDGAADLGPEDIIRVTAANSREYAIISGVAPEDGTITLRGPLQGPEIIAALQAGRANVTKVPVEELLIGEGPFSFCVLVPPLGSAEALQTVINIVNNEQPAHTMGNVQEFTPWFYLGGHTYLGINTVLSDRTLVLGTGALARDTVLRDRERSGRVGVRARTGIDTVLT